VVVTYRRGTNDVRNLKFLTLPYSKNNKLLTNITVPTRVVVLVSYPI